MLVTLNYDLSKNKNINFLFDYSISLKENGLIDEKISDWQVEKSELLTRLGVNVKYANFPKDLKFAITKEVIL